MHHELTRRGAIAVLSAAPLMFAARASRAADAPFAGLEARYGGRLGVAALDTGSGRRVEYRSAERFAMCSTFKFVAAGCALARADRGEESMDRRVPIAASDIVPYSPAVEKHVGGDMSVAELCEAAITLSDNAAGNLLLASFGGPAGLTAFFRSLGDDRSRLDRNEPDLNEARAGDVRDTTTPSAMLGTMNRLLLGDALAEPARRRLTDWLVANTTGGARIRAGVPKDWRVGDKTGTGQNGAANDIAILWPPQRPPVLVAVYYTESKAEPKARSEVIAEAARLAVAGL